MEDAPGLVRHYELGIPPRGSWSGRIVPKTPREVNRLTGRPTRKFPPSNDFPDGRAVSLRVTIRNEAIRETTFTSPAIQTTTGAGEILHRFAQDGSYEVFVEFETADEPGRTYRPEDWLVWISRAGIFAGSGWWVLGLSGLTAAGATLWWAHARARAIPVPPSPEDQS
jgi:hypothetical protein